MKRIVLTAAVAAAFVALVVTNNGETQTQPIRSAEIVAQKKVSIKDQKQLRRLALTTAKVQVSTWTCQDHLGVSRTRSSVSPWALPKSTAYRLWVLDKWNATKATCMAALQERKRQWNWQVFPAWIINLAVCESGGSGRASPGEPNWFAEGSSSHGSFYSAFNISRSVYDRDAHHMGVRGWYEGVGVPSPYEQAMAVIGHMRLYGDGFTGRCHGIARSSW